MVMNYLKYIRIFRKILESDDYKFFMIGELPRKYWRIYSTLEGSVLIRVARAITIINGEKLEIYVETP